MKKLLIIVTAILLTACGDSKEVSKVKSMIYPQLDSTITVGNVLDNREICKNVSWDSFKDDKKRDIVEYTCELKTDEANDYLKYQFDTALSYLEPQLLDINVQVTTESYQQYQKELEKSQKSKKPYYSIYANYVNADADSYIYSKYQLYMYQELINALKKMEKDPAVIRYQQNRNYVLSHRSDIEKIIAQRTQGYMNPKDQYIRELECLYSKKDASLVGSYNYFMLGTSSTNCFNINKLRGDNLDGDRIVIGKFNELQSDIQTIKSLLAKQKLYLFKKIRSIYTSQWENYEIDETLGDFANKLSQLNNIADCEGCVLILEEFLSGDKQKTVYWNDGSREFVVNNYLELFEHLKDEEQKAIDYLASDVITPYNDTVKSDIQTLQKMRNDTKITRHEQKIRWSLLGEQQPVLMSCDISAQASDLPTATSDPQLSSDCFRAAYSDTYKGTIYNPPVYKLFGVIASKLKTKSF